jgi:hypothetical protein
MTKYFKYKEQTIEKYQLRDNCSDCIFTLKTMQVPPKIYIANSINIPDSWELHPHCWCYLLGDNIGIEKVNGLELFIELV